ncbi:MAG: hypothetical protein IT290_12865, partial [Deltaproteobacteria bacterium]|nr:hypothetical protein [Deltaproteobacteria bacterium]
MNVFSLGVFRASVVVFSGFLAFPQCGVAEENKEEKLVICADGKGSLSVKPKCKKRETRMSLRLLSVAVNGGKSVAVSTHSSADGFEPATRDFTAAATTPSVQSAIDFPGDVGDPAIARFGTGQGTAFESLVEMRTQQTLTGFSGQDVGRGAIRLNDTVDGDAMELGFYRYGAGLFHPGLFEFWTGGVSIRQLRGDSPSYLGVRDKDDVKQIRLGHNATDGTISTDDQPTNSDSAGGVSIRPNARESWKFEQTTGNLISNPAFGGNLVFSR